jgi:hypothetical protein
MVSDSSGADVRGRESANITLRLAAGVLLCSLALSAPPVSAEMWKCVEQDGSTRYTNVKADAKGCKSLNLEPERPAAAPVKVPASTARTANFPSVDGNTQKQRDAERRNLLDRELGDEQRGLELAKKELAEQKAKRAAVATGPADTSLKPYEDRVRRHEINIDSLRKELASIK